MSTATPEQPKLENFHVSLAAFAGPFELLLNLIAKHELPITEIALSVVTDEFISHVKQLTATTGLQQTSEFLVVATTLLDMKLVSLLPHSEAADATDIALLEARDLLFARLLQYRAFKEISGWFQTRLTTEQQRISRAVPLEPQHQAPAPALRWQLSPSAFAALAAAALQPKTVPTVGLTHLHAPQISIREQAAIAVTMLRSHGQLTLRELLSDTAAKNIIIARFLAVLELFRHGAIIFEQDTPLGDCNLRWVAHNWHDSNLTALGSDYDS